MRFHPVFPHSCPSLYDPNVHLHLSALLWWNRERVRQRRGNLRVIQAKRHTLTVEPCIRVRVGRALPLTQLHLVQRAGTWLWVLRVSSWCCRLSRWGSRGHRTAEFLAEARCEGVEYAGGGGEEGAEFGDEVGVGCFFDGAADAVDGRAGDGTAAAEGGKTVGPGEGARRAGVGAEEGGLAEEGGGATVEGDDAVDAWFWVWSEECSAQVALRRDETAYLRRGSWGSRDDTSLEGGSALAGTRRCRWGRSRCRGRS